MTLSLRSFIPAVFVTLVAVACGSQAAAPTTPGSQPPSLQPTPTRANSAQPGGTGPSPVATNTFCTKVQQLDLSQLVGEPVLPVENSSTPTICTYLAAQASTPFDVIVRVEDTFEDIAAVRAAFGDGEAVPIADGGYWSPQVTTLWFLKGGTLYAVQITGVDDVARSKEIATQVAMAVSARI